MTIAAGEKLKPGMMLPRVEALQMRLGIEVTGSFNALTEEAVLAFQNASGLDADGAVGPTTMRALNRSGLQEMVQA